MITFDKNFINLKLIKVDFHIVWPCLNRFYPSLINMYRYQALPNKAEQFLRMNFEKTIAKDPDLTQFLSKLTVIWK